MVSEVKLDDTTNGTNVVFRFNVRLVHGDRTVGEAETLFATVPLLAIDKSSAQAMVISQVSAYAQARGFVLGRVFFDDLSSVAT